MVEAAGIRTIDLTFRAWGNILTTMRLDLHVHTTLSACSQLDLDQLVAGAAARGLDGVCITDHDTMAVRHHLREGRQVNGLYVFFGMEYATRQGDFLIFGPFEEIAADLSAPDLLRQVHGAGGVAVAAHPYRPGRSTSEGLLQNGLCSIAEGINGRNGAAANEQAMDLPARFGTHLVGGSDAHSLPELGRVATHFLTEISSRADLVTALKSGRYAPHSSLASHALCA